MEIGRQYHAVGMGTVAGSPDPAFNYASPPELVTLREMLADARVGRPRFVLLEGERGIGKTAFLRQLSADLSDTQVLWACGDESEADLRYGVVEHLARSVGEVLPEELAVLCDRTKPEPEPFAVGHALLRLLVTLQQKAPVLVLVDDADLADDGSQVALLFALRRLHDSRVLTVLAARDPGGLIVGMRKLFSTDHGATLTLKGLDHGSVMRLGASLVGQWLPRRFVERLREHTGGNPSHIRSVLATLDGAGNADTGDGPLPAPPACHSIVFERLSRCGVGARRLAAAAAVLGERCSLELVRKLANLDEPLQPLQAAIDARLVECRGRDVVFVNPLVRAALYHQLGVSERAGLHRRAAELVTEEGARLRHLVAAAFDYDPGLAQSVADFAARTAAVGSALSASGSFVDAAELVPPGPARDAYVLEAVECLLAAGDPAGASLVAARFVDGGKGARALVGQARVARVVGRMEDAEELLIRAQAASGPEDLDLQGRIATELATVSVALLRPAEAARWADTSLRVTAGSAVDGGYPPVAWALAIAGRSDEALALLEVPATSLDELTATDAGLLLGRVVAELFTGAVREARDRAAQQVRIAGRSGRLPLRLWGLAMLSLAEYRLGRWSDAAAYAEQGAAMAETTGPGLPRTMLHLAALLPLAGRGQWEAAESTRPRGLTRRRIRSTPPSRGWAGPRWPTPEASTTR